MMDKNKKILIDLLNSHQVVKFGTFTLSSGRESSYYVDMKKAITDPQILSQIALMIAEKIQEGKVDKIAGPALGAVPIATAVSIKSGIPMLMIRKAKKDYGTTKLIEGDLKNKDRVIVVEDVTTTGNSLLNAINAINDNGGVVVGAFVAVDREEGALENLKKNNIKFEPLVTISDF
jgi:orotate phosphoribosyltransferase